MASSSQSAPATSTTAAIRSGTASNTSETIVGSHVFKIDGFSATKHLGVGKCIQSSTFRVGGLRWYIECYPCGDNQLSAGSVSLLLCREDEDDQPVGTVLAKCQFNLMKSLKNGCFKELNAFAWDLATFTDENRHSVMRTDFIKRSELQPHLKDDCFQVRCLVFIEKFPVAPPADLATETVAGSHLLTVDGGYPKTRRAFFIGEFIESSKFRIGGHSWYLSFFPRGESSNYDYDNDDDDDADAVEDRVTANLTLADSGDNDEVKVRLEVTLLTHAGRIISSTQDFSTFSETSDQYVCNFLIMMEHESSPFLQDGIKIRCDIAVVDGITHLCRGIGRDSQQIRGDVTFEVAGHLFAAHKCVLTTRCTAFMAEFFGPAGTENNGATELLRIDDMEPRVFEALLNFIYTDALPEVSEEDKVRMAQGLLVAADRYAMERLKLICADMLCSYVNNARTAVTTLNLADKHGCRMLKEVCMKFLMDQFANVAS